MRIISGRFKGHKLLRPKGAQIRPTAQKVKQALFSILGEAIQGACFLELYAGTAGVGIEALSRGASEVYFVENARSCIRTIEQNLQQLKIPYNYGLTLQPDKDRQKPLAYLLPFDAEKAVDELGASGKKFDFVFLDPPYAQGKLKNSLIKISHYDILKTHSWAIAEHQQDDLLPDLIADGFKLILKKRYGDTALSFYQKEDAD